MKCSRRNAPMGPMPESECRRRSRNELPTPARKGATPGLILGAAGLAGEATMGSLFNSNIKRRTGHYHCAVEAESRRPASQCRCSKIMSPPNCNETLSPSQDGDDESERVPTSESD